MQTEEMVAAQLEVSYFDSEALQPFINGLLLQWFVIVYRDVSQLVI